MRDLTLVALIALPLRVNAATNARMHWRTRAKVAQAQRKLARIATLAAMPADILNAISTGSGKVGAVMVRYGKRKLDDDNLATAFKHVRDGIADALGLDDGSPRYKWEYRQVKGTEYKVEIEIGVENPR